MRRLAKRVLLIGWDGADWQHINPLLDSGKLPGLQWVVEHGCVGNLATLNPVLSPMLWNSVATGKTADKHGILGFTEPSPDGKSIRPFSSYSRKVKAIWNILHQNGMRSNVVGWWASHPAEPINGNVVTNLFNGIRRKPDGSLRVTPGVVHPAERAAELSELKVHIEELKADDLLPFIPLAAKIDQKNDKRFYSMCKVLSDCASIHAVTTHLLETSDWDLTAVYYDAIDHFCHAFMHYHPPQMPNVADEDFEIYKGVIAGAYQFHDMMLQRLIQLAGPDTTVLICSDHGFQSGPLRPLATPLEPAGPASWHRHHGIIAIAGPGIRQDERIYGANLIDIAPTVLTLLGVPVGEDMDGRVLADAFEQSPAIESVESWDHLEGDCGMHPVRKATEPVDAASERDLMQQFVALGYIDDPAKNVKDSIEKTRLEIQYNLARVYLTTGRPMEALPIFCGLVKSAEWEDRYWKFLAQACFETGYYRQAFQILGDLYPEPSQRPVFASLLMARSLLRLDRQDEGRQLVRDVLSREGRNPVLLTTLGQLLADLGEIGDALEIFERALLSDPDYAFAHQCRSTALLKEQRWEEAIDSAKSAVGLVYRLPQAHWNIGVATANLGSWQDAKVAFESILQFNDSRFQVAAHRQLAKLLRQAGDLQQAKEHAAQARSLHRRNQAAKDETKVYRNLLIDDLPSIPDAETRHRLHLENRPLPGSRPKGVAEPSGRTLTIVSGLPRSGTSLMMQMLKAAGIPAKTDEVRAADVDNPRGYFEWESIKQLPRDPTLLDDPDLDDQAIKVISMLLPYLPRHHSYRVIFMMRPIEQIVASQRAMIERGGMDRANEHPELADQLQKHRDNILKMLEKSAQVQFITMDYPTAVAQPQATIQEVLQFLGRETQQEADIREIVDQRLYRNR